MRYKPEIAIIMRSDEVIQDYHLERHTINTSFGPVDRCFFGKIYGVEVMIVYGRFNGQKVPSDMINYQQTMEAIANAGAKKVIGTFVVGGISDSSNVGDVYIISDFVGFGNYHIQVDQKKSFHNAEMYTPICKSLSEKLKQAALLTNNNVKFDAVYVCFHGWPRIETKAELDFYNRMGWDIVGQTCDPEATIARLLGLCYAALAVQIDDPKYRNDSFNKVKLNDNTLNIIECRKHTTEIVLKFLERYTSSECLSCDSVSRKNTSFREFPKWFYE